MYHDKFMNTLKIFIYKLKKSNKYFYGNNYYFQIFQYFIFILEGENKFFSLEISQKKF